jgi:hypothetical protein
MTRVITERKAVISQPMMIPRPDNLDAIEESKIWCAYYEDFISPDEICMEPMSQWFYPIIDTVDHIKISNVEDYDIKYSVKAILVAEFYWRNLLRNILPINSKGLVMVVENSCVPDDFTYQIDGPITKYLGVGDKHDPKYDEMLIESALSDLNAGQAGLSDYSGLPLDNDTCQFKFRLYPSDEMREGK